MRRNVLNVYQLYQNSKETKDKKTLKNREWNNSIKRWVLCKVNTWTNKMKLQNNLTCQKTCRKKQKSQINQQRHINKSFEVEKMSNI